MPGARQKRHGNKKSQKNSLHDEKDVDHAKLPVDSSAESSSGKSSRGSVVGNGTLRHSPEKNGHVEEDMERLSGIGDDAKSDGKSVSKIPSSGHFDVGDSHERKVDTDTASHEVESEGGKINMWIQLNNTLVRTVKELRTEKDQLTGKISHLEEQLNTVTAAQSKEAQDVISSLEIERLSLLDENKALQERRQAMESEKALLENKTTGLASEKFSLEKEKDELELALADSRSRLEETSARIKQAEQVAQEANARVLALVNEKEQLESALSETNDNLTERSAKIMEGERAVEKSKAVVQALMNENKEIKRALDKSNGLLREREAKLEEAELAVAKASAKIGDAEKVASESNARVATLLSEKEELESSLSDSSKLLEERVAKLREAEEERVEVLVQKRNELERSLSYSRNLLKEKEAKLEDAEHAAAKVSFRIMDAEEVATDAKARASALVNEKNELMRALSGSKSRLEETESKIVEAERAAADASARVVAAEREAADAKARFSALIIEKDELKDELSNSSCLLTDSLAKTEKATRAAALAGVQTREAEQNAAQAKSRVQFLDEEILKLNELHERKIESLEESNKLSFAEFHGLEVKTEELEKELEKLSKSLVAAQEEANEATSEVEVLRYLEKVAKEENEQLQSKLRAALERSADLDSRNNELNAKLEELECQNSKLNDMLAGLESTLAHLRGELKISEEKANATSKEVQEGKDVNTGLQEDIFALHERKDRIERELIEAKNFIEQLNDSIRRAQVTMVTLEDKVSSLETQKNSLREENSKLELALSSASERSDRLDRENWEFKSLLQTLHGTVCEQEGNNNILNTKLADLESTVSELQDELRGAKTRVEEVTRDFGKETAISASLSKEASEMKSRNLSLEGELGTARSCIEDLQESIRKAQESIYQLEGKVALLVTEQTSLLEAKASVEKELQNVSSKSSEALENLEEQIQYWKEKVESVEKTLEDAKFVATASESRIAKLLGDLESVNLQLAQSSNNVAKYTWRAASGSAIAVVGVLAFLKFSKRR